MFSQTTYHLSNPFCPYCDYERVCYSANRFLDMTRRIFGSRSRYCPRCEKKWRVRSRRSSRRVLSEFFIVLLAGGLGYATFFIVSNVTRETPTAAKINEAVKGRDADFAESALSLMSESGPAGLPDLGNIKNVSALVSSLGSFDEVSKEAAKRNIQLPANAESYLDKFKTASPEDRQRMIAKAKRQYQNKR